MPAPKNEEVIERVQSIAEEIRSGETSVPDVLAYRIANLVWFAKGWPSSSQRRSVSNILDGTEDTDEPVIEEAEEEEAEDEPTEEAVEEESSDG